MFQTASQIPIKSTRDIEKMRDAGKLLHEVFCVIDELVAPGVSTQEIDQAAHDKIVELGATPAFLNLYGFPASVCASLNEELVHGIPSSDRVLREGDILSIDMGVLKRGWYSDRAFTYMVGEVAPEVRRLVETTQRAFWAGAARLCAGKKLGDAQNAIQRVVEGAGMHVVRKYVGHGIGRQLHESPQVANFGRTNTGPRLKPGMVLAVEPMVGLTTAETRELDDGWTVVMADGGPSAHYEHTVAITDNGPEILTWPEELARKKLEEGSETLPEKI